MSKTSFTNFPLKCLQNGDTSLHISAAMGRRKLTRVLLESGCDREMKNKQSETAAEIAKRKSLAEIVQILKSTPPSVSINPSEKYGERERMQLDVQGQAPKWIVLFRGNLYGSCAA